MAFDTKIAKIIIALSIGAFLIFSLTTFLTDPKIWPDEAIYFDTYTTLSKTGIMATNIFKDAIPGLQVRAFWYPPLYFYILSFWTTFFGQTIEVARSFSFVCSLATIGVFIGVLKMLFKKWSYIALGVVLLIFDTNFETAAKTARMDMLTFLFIVSAVWVYLQARMHKKAMYYWALGVLFGLAIITHPLGFIAPVTIFPFLLFDKDTLKRKFIHTFCVLVPVFIALMWWYGLIMRYFSLFLDEYMLQFARKTLEAGSVVNLLQGDIVWRILFVLYALLSLLLLYSCIRYKTWILWFSFLGLLVSTFAILWGKEGWYLLYFQPFITLSLLGLMHVFSQQQNKLLQKIIIIFCIIVFSANSFFTVVKIQNSKNADYYAYTGQINQYIPNNATIFLATIPDPYFGLLQRPGISIIEFPTVPISSLEYKRLLDQSDYVIVNFMPDIRISQYVNKYAVKITQTTTANEYVTFVVQLAPKNKRF